MEKDMAIEIAPKVNSLSSQDQVLKENTKMQVKDQALKKTDLETGALSENDLKTLVDTLEKGIVQFNRRLKFDINKEIDRIIVKVIDKDTDKVIREIPAHEIQTLILKIREALGLLFDIEI
jgi:flagellar protein FlaG